jgi:hypothetical protein
MKPSSLLITLGALLSATTFKWSELWDRRTLREICQDAKAGKLHTTLYTKIVAPVSVVLIIVGTYLDLTWR